LKPTDLCLNLGEEVIWSGFGKRFERFGGCLVVFGVGMWERCGGNGGVEREKGFGNEKVKPRSAFKIPSSTNRIDTV
jgi:hypothetical protein